MARKEKKYHYIYKTTNLKNGRYYVGMHSTDNFEDGYMGSGKRFRRSLNKHGKENFKFEILEFLQNRESLIEREKELVNEGLLKDSLSMNLKKGGTGGFVNDEHRKKFFETSHDGFRKKLKEDEEFRNKISKIASDNFKKAWENGKVKHFDWTGKKHKKETKLKMSEKAKLRSGEKSSQFGTCWITNGIKNKKIKKEELNKYICNGWYSGRICEGKSHLEESRKKISEKAKLRVGEKSATFGYKWITNGLKNKLLKPNEILPEGWVFGKKIDKDILN